MLKDKVEICFPESDAELDLLTLPFKSTYRVLSWQGITDNTLLTPDFNLLDVIGKLLVIKSFKLVPYYLVDSVDMFVNDGVTTNAEVIPINGRIDRLFDYFGLGTLINFRINGGPVNLFNAVFPLDVDLQNIYFKYPEKIQDLTLQINSTIYQNLTNGNTGNAKIKVNMEVYLI